MAIYGKRMTAEEVIAMVRQDEVFYLRTGGGLTLGGGEPLAQPEFALAILELAGKARINTNMETCGYVRTDALLKAGALLHAVFMDVKCMDPQKHEAWTGKDNALILQNIVRLRENFPKLPITLRTPVIPGFNDTAADIRAIAKFAADLDLPHELLPYHRYGESKYARLGRDYGMGEAELEHGKMEDLKAISQRILANRG